jgi:hypothetical protein
MRAGAQLENNEGWLEGGEGRLDARRAACGRFAANAGVDHPMFVTLGVQTGLQQSGPGLVNIDTIAGTQAVAEYEHGRRL